MFIITNFGTSLFVSTIPYVFIHDLGANERALSICFAMLGTGALLGSFCSVKLIGKFYYGSIVVGVTFLVGACYLISPCFSAYHTIADFIYFAYGTTSSIIVFFHIKTKNCSSFSI